MHSPSKIHIQNLTVYMAAPQIHGAALQALPIEPVTSTITALGGASNAVDRFELHASGLVVTDHKTGLMWPVYESEDQHDFAASEAYAKALDLAGFVDWFNPSREQRLSITDLSKYSPALFGPIKSRSNSWEWTSTGCKWTEENGAPRAFWQVGGLNGRVYLDLRDSEAFSRPCRFVARPGQ